MRIVIALVVFIIGLIVGVLIEGSYVYHTINVDEAAEILSGNGFVVQRVQSPKGGHYVNVVAGTSTFEVHVYNCEGDKECHAIQFSVGFKKTSKTSWGLINGWNERVRMVNAYLIEEGVVLEMDVTINGGVTKRNVEYHIDAWRSITAKFEEVLRTGAL